MRRPSTHIPALILASLALAPTAQACGGLFCDGPTNPVDQAGENILFAVDEEAEQITVHVQIQYEGAAEEFAWILPTPALPELQLGTDALFTALGNTRARFGLNAPTGGVAEMSTGSDRRT